MDGLEGSEVSLNYLWAYLHGSFGQRIMWRSASQTGQPHLTLKSIDEIHVPEYSMALQEAIERLYNRSVCLKQESQRTYHMATITLEKTLGMQICGNQAVSIKKLSDSFKRTGRLDAEYYQPKYDIYLDILSHFKTSRIPNEFDVFKSSGTNYAETISDVGVIKTKQITNSGVNIDGIESYFTREACIKNKSTFIAKNDVIFASMGVGSLGKVSLFSYDGDKAFVTDSTLRIYRAKEKGRVLPEVLCLFLQSEIGQELIYRYVVGSTGIINIYDDDMAKIPVPILEVEIQRDLAAKVQESFALRRQSKRLLFPQYFFQTFFQINRDFSYKEKTIDLDKDGNLKERYQASLHIADKHMLKFYLGISGQFRTTKYNESIKKEIDLRPIIRSTVEKHRYQNLIINETQFMRDFYDVVMGEITGTLRHYIDITLPKKGFNQTVTGKIRDACLRLDTALRLRFEYNYKYPHEADPLIAPNSYAIIYQIPFNGFSRSERENVYKSHQGEYAQLIATKAVDWFANYTLPRKREPLIPYKSRCSP